MTNEKDKHIVKRHGRNAENSNSKFKTLKMFSTNDAGVVNGKIDSLINEVKATGATIVTVQETHCRRKGRIQMDNMVVFESIRSKKGGGTICAIHQDLNPKLVAVLCPGISGYPRTGPVGKNIKEPDPEPPENTCQY